MSLILNIDTSGEHAVVSLAQNGAVLFKSENSDQREHAAFIQPAVEKILKEARIELQNIDAVAVVIGPGSYTGLRVALASTKGICFVTGKPLITIGTLPLMAHAGRAYALAEGLSIDFLCPMIDARRMEVFTAGYDLELQEKLSPCAMVLTKDSFVDFLLQQQPLFFGNGAAKWKNILTHTNALFAGSLDTTQSLAILSDDAFLCGNFTDLAYSEPLYLKEFYNGAV